MEVVGQISPEYIAGFFDGEGCVHIAVRNKKHYYAVLKLTQRRDNILNLIQQQWGGKVYWNSAWGGYHWHATGEQALLFAKTICPYLVDKKEQMEAYIDFMQLRRANRYAPHTEGELEQRENIRIKVKELKDAV